MNHRFVMGMYWTSLVRAEFVQAQMKQIKDDNRRNGVVPNPFDAMRQVDTRWFDLNIRTLKGDPMAIAEMEGYEARAAQQVCKEHKQQVCKEHKQPNPQMMPTLRTS